MEIIAENNTTNPEILMKKEHNYVSKPHREPISQSIKQVEKPQKNETLSAWQDEQALADFRW